MMKEFKKPVTESYRGKNGKEKFYVIKEYSFERFKTIHEAFYTHF